MATEVTCIVDTDGTQNPDYTSLAAAIAGESGASPKCVMGADLVANDEQLTIECRASSGAADGYFTLSGFVTDDDNYVKVYVPPAHRHSGKFDDEKYRIQDTAWNLARSTLDKAVYDGLQVTDGSSNVRTFIWGAGTLLIAKDCIVVRNYPGAVQSIGIYGAVQAENCIAIGFITESGTSGEGYSLTNAEGVYAYNCIAYGGYRGIRVGGNLPILKNCVAFGSTDADISSYSSHNAASDYNASGNTTPPGSHSVDLSGYTAAQIWTDAANGDFSLASGSPLIDAGIGPVLDINVPTTDIVGTSRSGDTCSIGAFEFVDEGGTYVDLAGSLNTSSQLTASLKRYIGMAGSANFTFSAENPLKVTRGISGLISVKADMSLAIGFVVNLSSIIEAGGNVAGQIKIVKDISGNVSSTSSLAGVVKPFRGMGGNILIPSSLEGTSKATRNLIGASETVSDLAASLKPIRGISGVIDSRAEVAGFTSIFKTIIGAIASKANLSAVLELSGTIEFSGSISTKGEMASNLRLNLPLSGEITTAPSLKGNIRTFKTLSGALETVTSIVGDAMRIRGFSGDIASATSIEGYLVRDMALSGAITSSIDVNGKVKIILSFSGSMDSLASLIASLSTFIPSTLGNPIDVSIVSVSTQRELYSITIKRTLTEV